MRYVPDSPLGASVWRRWSCSVWPIASHRCSEDDAPLDPELDEFACCNLGTGESTKNVQIEQLQDLLTREIKSWLVLCHASVGDHSVEATLGFDDLVERCFDRFVIGDICLNESQIWVLLAEDSEVLAWLHKIERVYDLGGVFEAHLRNTETDTTISAGDGDDLVLQRNRP